MSAFRWPPLHKMRGEMSDTDAQAAHIASDPSGDTAAAWAPFLLLSESIHFLPVPEKNLLVQLVQATLGKVAQRRTGSDAAREAVVQSLAETLVSAVDTVRLRAAPEVLTALSDFPESYSTVDVGAGTEQQRAQWRTVAVRYACEFFGWRAPREVKEPDPTLSGDLLELRERFRR